MSDKMSYKKFMFLVELIGGNYVLTDILKTLV